MDLIRKLLKFKDLIEWVLRLVDFLKGYLKTNPVPVKEDSNATKKNL